MTHLLDDTAALEALFNSSPDPIMVERFEPPLPQSDDPDDTAAFGGDTIVHYTNPAFVRCLSDADVADPEKLTSSRLAQLHDDIFDDQFKLRWRSRKQQVLDNLQLSQHYLPGSDRDDSLLVSTTPIIEDGLVTGCLTRITDATSVVIDEADERRALRQIDGFVRTENAPLICLAFETPVPKILPAEELGNAYLKATVTHITEAAVTLFGTTREAMLQETLETLDNLAINRLMTNAFPPGLTESLNLEESVSLVVEVPVSEEKTQTYQIKPTFVFAQNMAIEAWMRIEDITRAEFEAREQQKIAQTRALAMSAASLHQFESGWQDGVLKIEGPAWEALGLEEYPTDIEGWRNIMSPHNMSISQEEIDDVFAGNTTTLNFILRVKDKHGEERHIEVWGLVYPDETGNTPGETLGLFRDVTDNEKLRSRLREKKTLEGLGVLAGGIAHDFNNILMSVLGYAELMEADLLEATPRDGLQLQQSSLQNIKEIRTAALRASDLCSSLLAYAGQHLIEKKTLDLTELVRSSADLIDITIAKRVPVELDLGAEIPISADRGQLTRVLINLILNAADAMEGREGSVQLKVTTMELNGSDSTLLRDQLQSPDERMACITISDSGCGMSRDTLQRIYEPFFTTKEEGRGLGMAAAHGIIKNHGGGILVNSVEGEGTEFKICLPLLDHLPTSEQPALEPPTEHPGPPRVLVVDDEAGVRTIAAEMLRHLNCDVSEADSAEAALGLFATQEFDYALLDITMPVMSGTELAELLIERLPKLKVVLCSGYTDKDLPEALLARCAFIHKPFTLKEISDTLELKDVSGEQAEPA